MSMTCEKCDVVDFIDGSIRYCDGCDQDSIDFKKSLKEIDGYTILEENAQKNLSKLPQLSQLKTWYKGLRKNSRFNGLVFYYNDNGVLNNYDFKMNKIWKNWNGSKNLISWAWLVVPKNTLII